MNERLDYQAAVTRAEMQKARFLADAQSARNRVSTARLKADAKASVRQAMSKGSDKAKATARRHPVAIGAVSVGLFAFLFRRPLAALLGWVLSRRKTHSIPIEPSVAETPASTEPPIEPENPDEK